MNSLFDTTGLNPQQIDSIDVLTNQHRDDERKIGLEAGIDALARIDQFSSHIRAQLEEFGLDLNDPQVHFAVVAGASIMANFVCAAPDTTDRTKAATSIIMNAVVNNRPIRDIQ